MIDRRTMLTHTALAAGGLAASSLIAEGAFALPSVAPRRVFGGKLAKLNVLQIGVGGSIAPADRHELMQHPDVNFAGLCDVDSDALKEVSAQHPAAFTCSDFREAFDKHAGQFDAVVVCTPDHNHALIMMTALKAGKPGLSVIHSASSQRNPITWKEYLELGLDPIVKQPIPFQLSVPKIYFMMPNCIIFV